MSLGSEAPGRDNIRKKVVREAGAEHQVHVRLSIQFESLVGRQMTRPEPTKNGRSRLMGRPSK
jgi:hypothetical protein